MNIEFHCSSDYSDRITAINVAKSLIEHETTYHHTIFNKDITENTFDIEDLEEIANHILVYCKAERVRNGFREKQNK